jgi:hypothetical protein
VSQGRGSEREAPFAGSRAMVVFYNGTWSEEPPIDVEGIARRIER